MNQALDGGIVLRRVDDAELRERLYRNRKLVEIASSLLAGFSDGLGTLRHVIYMTDQDGIVLFSAGNQQTMLNYGLLPGFDWSERVMGTNGAGTALATARPVAVIGPDHYQMPFQEATCMAAPIHSPSNDLLGAVDLSTHVDDADTSHLTLVVKLATFVRHALAGQITVLVIGKTDGRSSEGPSLADSGFSVIRAHAAEAALQKTASLRPDAIVLDGGSGHDRCELCRKIQADGRTLGIPIVQLLAEKDLGPTRLLQQNGCLVHHTQAQNLRRVLGVELGKNIAKGRTAVHLPGLI